VTEQLQRSGSSVPFVDLRGIHEPLREAILEGIAALIESGAFVNGPEVAEFERAFADYCGTARCVGMSSGLDALRIALLAAGIESGDEVIVPANTFVATLEAVTQAGGVPVVVDVTEHDYNLDAAAVEAAVGERTRFVIPVHLYGQLADMAALTGIAAPRELILVEDAAQAHGATRDGFVAGATGRASAFSFYPAKNLGAMGDAGALVTNDDELARRARALREHGQEAKYDHRLEGFTARLDTLQALVLLAKLPLLDGWNEERRAAAAAYHDGLAGIGDLVLPPVPAGSEPVWHVYPVRTASRDRLAPYLAERGIATARHYPVPVHRSPAYAWLGLGAGAAPVAEALADELLSLPIYPGIAAWQLELVVEAIGAFFGRG
jgi:dTDP-4-amino-4,6-dideoxygalactose transaminase